MARKNPFTPSFGKVPAVLAGRDLLLDDMAAAFEQGSGDPNLSTLLMGARGTGKTALMTSIAREASANGWITADVSAVPGMLEDVYERVVEAAGELLPKEGARLRALNIAPLGGVEWESQPEVRGNWRTRMNGVLDVLARTDTGLLITVDEIQPDLDELILLAAVYQHFVREDRKVALVMAGLPRRVSALLSNKTASFLRRARLHRLGRIPDYEVRDALARTIEEAGGTADDGALDVMTAASGGFPYMMQLVGYRVWRVAKEGNVDRVAAERGAALARAELEHGVLEKTYAELSQGDRRFLSAMLRAGTGCTVAAVAQAMGVGSNYASQYKSRLMEQGIVGERPGGELSFDMPFMEEYLLQHIQE